MANPQRLLSNRGHRQVYRTLEEDQRVRPQSVQQAKSCTKVPARLEHQNSSEKARLPEWLLVYPYH